MRIVYDDAMQVDFIKVFNHYMSTITREVISSRLSMYEYGTSRVQSRLIKTDMKKLFGIYDFSIGDTVVHANGIGNNCQYPIYYHGSVNEIQQVCYININSGLYGECYIYLSDYNQQKITSSFKLNQWGIEEK